MEPWLLADLTVAFVVFSADSVAEPHPRPPLERAIRSMLWPVTLSRWFTHRSMAKLARFGAIVWLLVTGGWLLSWEYDRFPGRVTFPLLAEATLAFVVYCVDAMSADLQGRLWRRLGRSLFWPAALTEYMRDDDSVPLVQATVIVWVLLTTGWLFGLELDRVAKPLGWKI